MSVHFDSHHPLSRFYVFSNPSLKVSGPSTIPSLQFMYLFIRIFQMEIDPSYQGPSAELFARNKFLADYPKVITRWLQERGVDLSYGITDTFSMFVNIVYHIALKNSEFRSLFEHSNLDGQVKYFNCVTDRTYGTGISAKHLMVGDEPTGVNGWGQVLQTVADCLSSQVEPSSYREFKSNYVSSPPNPTPAKNHQLKSVLVLTDHYGCNIRSIVKGLCVYLEYGGFSEIADRCMEDNINLSEFEFIIIALGNNEICRLTEVRDLSWGKFEQFMGPEIERRRAAQSISTILVSYPLPVQNINGVYTFYDWLTSKIEHWNVSALNWRHKQCPLFRDDGRMEMGLFEDDAFLLKHAGVRRLWKCWVDHFNELTFVGVTIN